MDTPAAYVPLEAEQAAALDAAISAPRR